MLRALMDEEEEDKFHKQCAGFLGYLLESGFKNFHDYFKVYYLCASRIQLWPMCYRRGITLNTNNHLESMHKLLKYVYLKGKKVKRLDNTLLALETLVKDKLFKRMVDLMKNRMTSPLPVSERHKKGISLEVIQEDHGLFTVWSDTYKNKYYQIEAHNVTCESCRDRCPYCQVCKCMYICSCDDNAAGRKNICKHIHAVGNFLKNKPHPSKPKSPTEEIEMIKDIVCKEDSTRSQVEEQITEVKMKLQSLLSECDEMKDLESVKALNNYLSKAHGIIRAGRTNPAQSNTLPVDTSTVLEPSNKNVVKQDRLHTTKKRKQKDEGRSLKKPSVRARREIGESLAKSQSDISFPILSTGAICDDHSYC